MLDRLLHPRRDFDLNIGDRQHAAVVYDYTHHPGTRRTGKLPGQLSTYLQVDAYATYDKFFVEPARPLVEVGCFAHYLESDLIQSRNATCATGWMLH